jgi:hypothetical protein
MGLGVPKTRFREYTENERSIVRCRFIPPKFDFDRACMCGIFPVHSLYFEFEDDHGSWFSTEAAVMDPFQFNRDDIPIRAYVMDSPVSVSLAR